MITLGSILTETDSLLPNAYPDEQKINWLSVLDGKIFWEIIQTHEGGAESFSGYNALTDRNTELLVQEPYGRDLYVFYLQACVCRENAEFGKYNQFITMYNNAFSEMAADYSRNHMPLGRSDFIF